MGKTKLKTIDEAQVEEPKKPAKKLGRQDELVERLKAELEKETIDDGKLKIGVEDRELKVEKEQIHPQPSTIKKPSSTIYHPSSKKIRSKKYQEASKDLNRSTTYALNEAVDMVKKSSYSKFTGTLEAHINTAQTGIRGLVSLPFASGKKLKILTFATNTSKVGLPAGRQGFDSFEVDSVIFGDDSTIEEISKGKINFDLVVTTPNWMPKLAKIARILGPRGLMPNPKNGTITDNLKKAVEGFQAGKTEYKTESKAPVIHLGLGKLNQPTEQLSANIKILLQTLGKTRVKKVTLSPTMGPSVKLDLASL